MVDPWKGPLFLLPYITGFRVFRVREGGGGVGTWLETSGLFRFQIKAPLRGVSSSVNMARHARVQVIGCCGSRVNSGHLSCLDRVSCLNTLNTQLDQALTLLFLVSNVNLALLNPLILKCARGPGRNNQALGIKYAKSGLVFFGGV